MVTAGAAAQGNFCAKGLAEGTSGEDGVPRAGGENTSGFQEEDMREDGHDFLDMMGDEDEGR